MVRSFNLNGVMYFFWARFVNRSLAIPHIFVPDISKLNPFLLKEGGFEGGVFDKDSTLTLPYGEELHPSLENCLPGYKQVFKGKLAIMSDSAGTRDDKNYEAAKRIERNLGIAVLRHDDKKPGGIEAVIDYFGCAPDKLFIMGDRVFTDIVFGNRYGMLTVLTSAFSEEGDNKVAALLRRYERSLVKRWVEKGISAPVHPLYCKDVLI